MSQVQGNLRESFRDLFRYLKILLTLLIILYFLSGFYTVRQNEVAVVEQFGEVIESAVTPGISYALPWPMGQVYRLPSKKQIKTVVIDHFTKITTPNSNAQRFYLETRLSPYCITGDNNIITIQFHIKYFINDPVTYLYQHRDPERLLSATARSIMVHFLAGMPVDRVLTSGKQQIAFQVKNRLQKSLNQLKTGIGIDFVELKLIAPPEVVQRFFNDVINAKIEKQKQLDDAYRYRNRVRSETKKETLTMKQSGVLYRKTRVGEAHQEVTLFLKQLKEYQKFPESHRQKLYMDRIYPRLQRVKRMFLVDPDRERKPLRIEINYDQLRYLFTL